MHPAVMAVEQLASRGDKDVRSDRRGTVLVTLCFLCARVEAHGHLLRAVIRPGMPSATTACAANAGPHCTSSQGLQMRRLIPRSGNGPPCSTPPGCELGCEGNGNGPGGTGGGPDDPPCPNQGICDHCALEKTAAEKGIVGGDPAKWWTKLPAAHWDEPDQWPIFPCMSRDEKGARGTAQINPGDSVTTTLYMNADHSGLYRYELACGEQDTNEAFNAPGADLTPWLALHPSKELPPGSAPLSSSREVGRTRAETDAYFSRTVCTAASCPYRMNGGTNGNVIVHELGSAGCGPVPAPGEAQTVGPPVDGSSAPQCFIEDTFAIPSETTCRGRATLRWMWNSAEGLETYANCLDVFIEGSAEGGGEDGGDGKGGSVSGEDDGQESVGGGDDLANGANGGGSNSMIAGLVVAALVVGLVAGVAYHCSRKNGSVHDSRRKSEDPKWVAEPAHIQPAPPLGKPPEEPLPDGFVPVDDPTTGRIYYYNQSTGESTWHRPKVADHVEMSKV
uniref:WW domain-containing protein n=1 Tax=Haptolina brevifila TaxID=156173 RepID=A0A7S2GJN9_9EUKA